MELAIQLILNYSLSTEKVHIYKVITISSIYVANHIMYDVLDSIVNDCLLPILPPLSFIIFGHGVLVY